MLTTNVSWLASCRSRVIHCIHTRAEPYDRERYARGTTFNAIKDSMGKERQLSHWFAHIQLDDRHHNNYDYHSTCCRCRMATGIAHFYKGI